jgi:arabinofuranosyltransferase
VLGWTHRWIEEDAFLNFRIVDQIRAGHGPVFNIGQRVEVATSPLWLAMLTVARTVLPFVRIEYLALVGGLLLTGLGLWWAERGAAQLWRTDRVHPAVPLGAVVFVALPVSWEWATSGLENGLSLAWIGALLLVLATFARRDAAPSAVWKTVAVGALLGLGPLVRPDLTIMSVAAIVAVLATRRPRGAALAWLLGGFLALPVLSELFRMGYYGILVPNTALAKDAGGTYWSQGWNYLVDLMAPYWLWLPLLAIVAVAVLLLIDHPHGRERAGPPLVVVLALPVAGLLHALFIVKSGGDYLHARLLMPSLFALLAPFAAVPWSRKLLAPALAIAVWAMVAIAFLRPAIHQGFVPVTAYGVAEGRDLMTAFALPGRRPILAEDFIFVDGPLAKRLQARGEKALVINTQKKPILDATPQRTTLVSIASGISGYLAGPDVLVHEYNSLADPVGSHMPPNPNSGPGHRKRKGYPWVFALVTKPGVTDGFDARRIAAARAALQCGELRDLVASTEDPLDLGTFWSNLTGAIGRTRLVVPRDEFAAERDFCGDKGTIRP